MRVFIPIILLILFSCNQPGNPIQVKSPAPILAEDTLKVIKEFKGIYFNDGTKKFMDCGAPQLIYSIKNGNSQLDSALKKILPNAYSGEGIYVEMMAEMNASGDKNTAGLLEVKEILKTEQKGSQNTCIPYDFWCKGNEPFWQLQISKAENLIDHYDPMTQTTIHYLYKEPEVKGGIMIYTSSEKGKPEKRIRIVITEKKCSDGMSDKEYNYSVEMVSDKRYTGCALKYGE